VAVRRLALGIFLAGVILLGVLARLGSFAFSWVRGGESAAAVAAPGFEARFGARGSHKVGTQNLVIAGERPLEITLWYPAPGQASGNPATAYPYGMKMFGERSLMVLAAYQGQAFPGAPFDRSQGPYPLVVLSPGFAIGSKAYSWLAEHLASYGFVVISPEHVERLDPSSLWEATVARPRDILNVLSFVDQQVGPGGALAGLIDSETLAVVGHSYGGYTALAAAGARLDTSRLEAVCRSLPGPEDPLTFLCEALLPHAADMAESAGLDFVPKGPWPAWGDARVDAVVSMAGDAAMFGEAGLAGITAPVMVMGGTADQDSPYRWGTSLAYAHASSTRKVEVGFQGAGHFIFTGPCEALRRLTRMVPGGFCSDPAWNREAARTLARHFAAAFLLAELKHDPVASGALAPGQQAPGVIYRAQGY